MQTENNSTQSKKNKISLVLYIGGSIVAVMGIALLVNNIILYNQTIAQYVAQGYDSAEVVAQMPPTQLLPIVFQAIGLYGGVSLILFCMGLIFKKVSHFIDQPVLLNQPIVDELNLTSLSVNVIEEADSTEALEAADSLLSTTDQNTAEISETEIPTELPDDKKSATV
ncbi:MAG: hypothetical protein L6276_01375 [Acetobacterium sp.]|nr:hypothetical protein [Bacillota bacterium]MCG2728926.1 hypothetical protein [Acetobacterium sp.]